MSSKNLYDKPFDEGTIIKLQIFQKYFEEWLPPFVMHDFNKPIQVFDLFAGSGYDINGVAGSPIRIVEIIRKHSTILRKKNKQVFLFFNDLDKTKTSKLETEVNKIIYEFGLTKHIQSFFTSIPFSDCLKKYSSLFRKGCNLIFIDQNGFKEVNESIFHFLINLETSEFIFFISSSHIHRFANEAEVQKYHPKFDFEKIRISSRKKVHNVISEEFQKYVPKNINSYGLIPFSIMKDDKNNVYGLIFVSKHILGADKFLRTVWGKNVINGNANFDIDEDIKKNQIDMFTGVTPNKIENFQNNVRDLILNGEIKNNSDAYYYTINQGHLGTHASDEIKRMKKEKIITFKSTSPLVNYDKVIKDKRIIEYLVTNK